MIASGTIDDKSPRARAAIATPDEVKMVTR
jgi:hypothetical protein